MKNCLWLILMYSISAFSKDIHYKKIVHEISILSESGGYTKKITYKGKFQNKSDRSVSIIANELERISNFSRIDLITGMSIQNDIEINERSIETESFYDGLKEYSIQYEDTSMEFCLQYNISCKYLILLSEFPLVYFPNADTLVYEIKSPLSFFMKFKVDTNFRHFVEIDTVLISKDYKMYTVRSVPKYKLGIKKSFQSRYEVSELTQPSLRAIVISAGGNNEWQYFNNWFNNLIKDNVKLKTSSLKTISSISNGKESEEEIINKIYDYVKVNIKYVSIENGLEGFRPRDVNSVLINKYGDCKDMANLICQVLRYYNINASIALISTIGYRHQLDFPSLASANHAICIVTTKDGKTYYLDATDKAGCYYLPSQFIQGQHFFSFNSHGGVKGVVPIINSTRNKSSSFFYLTNDKTSLNGSVKNEYINYSGSGIKYLVNSSTAVDLKISVGQNLNLANQNVKYTKVNTEMRDSIVKIDSDVVMHNVLNKTENNLFLLLKFLDFPHQYPKKIKDHFRFITYQTSERHFCYQINLNDNVNVISKPDDFSFRNNSVAFDFSVKITGKNTVLVDYWYKIYKIEMVGQEIAEYEKLNESIAKIFNTSISYEIKK